MLTFGTDGIRGRANQELTMEVGLWVGASVAEVLEVDEVAIGRDTRASGFWLSQAVGLGLASMGVDVRDVGVAPTGALSFLARRDEVPTVVISASHNPFYDNGIKVFDASGAKIQPSVERAIEERLAQRLGGRRPPYGALGRYRSDSFLDDYVAWLVASVPLASSPRVVVDAAHGAASTVAVRALEAAGARVLATIGTEPNGQNINDGVGALHPERLAHLVLATGADLGLAFDGDADRLIAVAPSGAIVDGDDVLVLLAAALAQRGALEGPGIVATVMSQYGLEQTLDPLGVRVERCGVGDREVAAALTRTGFGLGGEQSGHVIVPRYAPTGDGLLTGLLVLWALEVLGLDADGALAQRVRFPQVHAKVAVREARAVADSPVVREAVRAAEDRLGSLGRVVLRPSGTEPVVRIMVEAPEEALASEVAQALEQAVAEVAAQGG
jgi:phosphoglucosamine mutase